MCGILIFDVTGHSQADIESYTTKSTESLVHRGPDGTSTQIVHFTHLMSFHRLAIINPEDSDGMQPVHDPRTNSFLICNGEIYNYKQLDVPLSRLSRVGSDIHVLLPKINKAVASLDPIASICAVLKSLDGEFALIFKTARWLIAARDPHGVRPLFIARNSSNRIVGFSSEAKALITGPGVHSVSVFPPGHVMISENSNSYVDTLYLDALCADINYGTGVPNQVRYLVEAAVKKRIEHSDRPVGILCSGGLDSAIITALSESMGKNLRIFTMRYASGHSDDAFYAGILCQKCGIDLEVLSFNSLDAMSCIEPVIRACETCDPNTIRAAIPMYLMAKYISEMTDVKVVLSGEGADELFCGYSYLSLAPNATALESESARLIGNLFMFDLLRADRCFAAFGLEVRVPYLDIALVDYVSGLPGESKMITHSTNFVEKRLLRDAFRDTGTRVGKVLSDTRIIDRTKERFSDGCGYSYVPQLLSNISNGATTLEERLSIERCHYGEIFDKIYGEQNRSLVTPRIMPGWAEIEQNQAMCLL